MKTTIIKIVLALSLINFMACVQKTHPKTILFKVDTTNIENIDKVGIRGGQQPLSWEETTFMTDGDGDGVFELTLEFKSASAGIEFKFVNQDEAFELQEQNNRQLPFAYKPETIVYKTIFNNAESTVSTK